MRGTLQPNRITGQAYTIQQEIFLMVKSRFLPEDNLKK